VPSAHGPSHQRRAFPFGPRPSSRVRGVRINVAPGAMLGFVGGAAAADILDNAGPVRGHPRLVHHRSTPQAAAATRLLLRAERGCLIKTATAATNQHRSRRRLDA
jgi:hypothetical protein